MSFSVLLNRCCHGQRMVNRFPQRPMPFLLVSLVLMLLSAKGPGLVIEQASPTTVRVSVDPSLWPSPEASFEASAEPSVEPELPPMAMSVLVNQSYMRHVDFIRQGLPMLLVRSFYNHALQEAAGPGCIPAGDTVILGRCTTPLFDENDGYAVKSLLMVISEEEGRSITKKYFPDLVTKDDLPTLTDDEREKISAAESETLQALGLGAQNGWEVSVFPTDEEIRFDPGKEASCTELAEKMPYTGLTMTGSSLTAFVLGMAAQIILINGDSPQARMILDNHAKLMYLATRCNRASGDKVEVPTQQLDDLIRRAKLALLARPETSETSLPPFEYMKDVIDGGRHFFAEEIERMSSLNSFGRINYITWTGDSVSSETLDNRMAGKTNLQTFKDYYAEREVSSSEPDFPCQSGFSYQKRFNDSQIDAESCCPETCLISSGRMLDVFIVNEMCCFACDEVSCDLSKLARVIQVEAFRFSRSGEQ